MTVKEQISKRYESNKQILKKLEELVEKYPQQRFGQILANYAGIDKDPFYIESVETLKILEAHCK